MGKGAELDEGERRALEEVILRARREVGARLEHALLFGSRARGTSRADSDLDLLLVFRRLPPDREPHASRAERIAAEVARRTGVPLGVWSVSLEDFREGVRTPMLADAVEDARPLWPGRPPPPAPFTPADAAFCAARLLDRVAEGSAEVQRLLAAGDPAWRVRVRDDLVRLCTALLLLAGETRPRRGRAVRRALERLPTLRWTPAERLALAWAARSYPPGHLEPDDDAPVPPPPVPAPVLLRLAERLRRLVLARLAHVRRTSTFHRP
jgi:predicted nucleotidyltransferase